MGGHCYFRKTATASLMRDMAKQTYGIVYLREFRILQNCNSFESTQNGRVTKIPMMHFDVQALFAIPPRLP